VEGSLKRISSGIALPLFSIGLLVLLSIPIEMSSTLEGHIIYNPQKFVEPQTEIFINKSQTWYGDFIVNQMDTVVIESCNFTVQDGDIYVYGNLSVYNSTITIRRNTFAKYIWVLGGNLTFNESVVAGRCVIWCYQGAQTRIYGSKVRWVFWSQAAVHIYNSTVRQAQGSYGCPAVIENSEVMYSGVYLRAKTSFSIISSNITTWFDVYIRESLPSSIQNLRIQPGYCEEWGVSDIEMNLNVTISDSRVNQWRLGVSNWNPEELINFSLIDSTLYWMSFDAGNAPSNVCNLTLKPGTMEHQNIYVDNNFNITILNSTVNNLDFNPRGGSYRFVDSNFSMLCWVDSNVSIINSTMTYLGTRDFYGNLSISNVTTNVFMLGIESGSMDLVLNEGYQDFLNFYNKVQGFNITIKYSLVNHWGVETFGNSSVNIFNSTITSDAVFSGLNCFMDSTVSIYNSNLDAGWFFDSSSLILFNSTMGTLYAYDDSNVTAINSVIGTIITDPVQIRLVNSTLFSEVYLSFELGSNYLTSSIEDNCDNPLPSHFQKISKYLKLVLTYDDYIEAQVRIYYDENELKQLGIFETVVKIYYLDEKTSQWHLCPIQGVNVTHNYVWANITSFSYFVLGTPSAKTISGGGSRKLLK